MKIDELYVPGKLAALLLQAIMHVEDGREASCDGKIAVPENFIVDLFLAAGAICPSPNFKMNENESAVDGNIANSLIRAENEELKGGIPEVIVEIWGAGEENLIRTIFNHKNFSLKAVAERYGGRSASANIANFLAKTDTELSKMRPATMQRIADALQCPVEWLMPLRNPVGSVTSSDSQA